MRTGHFYALRFLLFGGLCVLLGVSSLSLAQPLPSPLSHLHLQGSGHQDGGILSLPSGESTAAAHIKQQSGGVSPRLPGETMQQYLARNPQPPSSRLPPGNFTINFFGDSIDINPGNGSCADVNGLCGLRTAIMEANALQSGTFIYIPPGRVELSLDGVEEDVSATGDLDIYQTMRIFGAGANLSVIDANGIDRVFDIFDGIVDLVDIGITGGDVSMLTENPAQDGGGLWINCGADVLMERVSIYDNKAFFGSGVMIGEFCETLAQIVYLYESAVYGNIALLDAAVYAYQRSNLNLRNTTISNNSGPFVGGLLIDTHPDYSTSATHVTIADNMATISDVNGTGVYINPGSGPVTLINSIIAYNGDTNSDRDCGGAAFTSGDNVYTTGGCSTGSTDVLDVMLALSELGDYGGPTPTNAIGFMSSALGLDSDVTACPNLDQRGQRRPVGENCDSGAFELGYTYQNLEINGDFESASAGLPTNWTGKDLTQDRVRCNTPTKTFAYSGNCALRFRGGPGENSRFIQNYNARLTEIRRWDELSIVAAIRTNNAAAGGRLMLKGRYVNPSLGNNGAFKAVIVIPPGSSPYRQIFSAPIVVQGEISNLRAMLNYRGTRGTVLVDQVQVLWGANPEGTSIMAMPEPRTPRRKGPAGLTFNMHGGASGDASGALLPLPAP